MKDTLEMLKKNSMLAEGVEATDIADTDEIVSTIIDQKWLDSLAYQICDVQPIHGPTGAVFAVKYDGAKSIVQRNNVVVEDDAVINTGFTLEAIQDMQAQFGKIAINFIAKAFSGVTSNAENTKLLAKLAAVAADQGTLTLTTPANAESNVFEISQKVAESIIAINSVNYRSYDAFVVLPANAAAAFLALGSYFSDTDDEAGLFIGKKGRIKYYINPEPAATVAFVGINSKTPGNSSLIFSPYQHTMMSATDPDTGSTNVYNVNRYAITENALSDVGNEMVHSFTVA